MAAVLRREQVVPHSQHVGLNTLEQPVRRVLKHLVKRGGLGGCGADGKEIYTLGDCRLRRGSTGSANGVISNLELRVQTIIVGAEFDAGDELAFDSIEVRPAFLERWAPADWLRRALLARAGDARARAVDGQAS